MDVTKKYCDVCKTEIKESVAEFSFKFTSKAIFNAGINNKNAVLSDICLDCTKMINSKLIKLSTVA